MIRDTPTQQPPDSSEITPENADKMAETLQKHFSQKDADDFKKLFDRINSTDDKDKPDLDGYVSLCCSHLMIHRLSK